MTLQILDKDHEKKVLLNIPDTTELSEVEKRYSVNAIRIFSERYLLKSNDGQIVERLDDLFKRVAVAAGIMEVLYNSEYYNSQGGYDGDVFYPKVLDLKLEEIRNDNAKIDYADLLDHPENIKIGQFIVSPFHQESLLARYKELYNEGKLSVSFHTVLEHLENYGDNYLPLIQKYYDLMTNAIFLPNTPTLMNSGTKLGMLSACFVLGVEDSIESIAKLYTDVMLVFRAGGGVGVNYSKLRPENAIIKSTGGVSSGVLSFMSVVDKITDVIKQGSKRKGANMGLLNSNHPEIMKFITAKNNETKLLENFNISICTDNKFFESFFENKDYELSFDNKVYSKINAIDMMNKITFNAWRTGDPGMVFLENMNKNNLLRPLFGGIKVDSCNPCGEQILYANDSCTLGSINLAKFINEGEGKFDLEEFINTVRTATRFLDGVLDANKYPLPEINDITKACRRIGLGFMGLADAMTILGIQYNSEEGFLFCEFITAIMTMTSMLESQRQAMAKGPFPLWFDEKYKDKSEIPINAFKDGDANRLENNIQKIEKYFSYRFTDDKNLYGIIKDIGALTLNLNGFRNCNTTTVAPTGTLSMFADCSMGIEPNFSNVYTKKVTLGDFHYTNSYLEQTLKERNIFSKKLVEEIANNQGSVQGLDIPQDIQKTFVTAMDIHPFDHLMMQASAQRWITNAISKSINAPHDISPKLIEHCYVLAWKMGNKGTTVYRDKCKDIQVLNNSGIDKESNLLVSDYTKDYIMNTDLPDEYKQEIFADTPEIVESPIDDRVFVQLTCPNCQSFNSFEKNGSNSCFICRACGHGLGSCG